MKGYVPAERVRALLLPWLERGGSRRELARRSGVSQKAVEEIVAGRRRLVRSQSADALLVAIDRVDAWFVELADFYEAAR